MGKGTRRPQISPDDKWWWDGKSWRPIASPALVVMAHALDWAVIGMTGSVGRRYCSNRGQRCGRCFRAEVRKTNPWRIVGWTWDHHGRVPGSVRRALGRAARPSHAHPAEPAPIMIPPPFAGAHLIPQPGPHK